MENNLIEDLDLEEGLPKVVGDIMVYAKIIDGVYKGFIATRIEPMGYTEPLLLSEAMGIISGSHIWDTEQNKAVENPEHVVSDATA